jgi:hypothetical protein
LESSRVRMAIAPSSSDSKWTVGSEGETENSFDVGISPQINAARRAAFRYEIEQKSALI